MSGPAPDNRAEPEIEATSVLALGKYQLFASLGRGGMADVFLSVARGQMGVDKLAVIKRLRQALADEQAFRTMFLDEGRLAARLSHPNIVHTYEVGEHNGTYFIAMEYLEGQSLNKVVKELSRRKERIPPQIAVRVVADALAGLHYAHELRDYDGRPLAIIHRDVSPHNIFVSYDGHTKVVDFGIAKAALSSTETEVGVLKGKVSYMSPEQARGGPIDGRADVFAMGIVLWELVSRQRLMAGDSAANTLHKLMNEPIPRLSQALPGVDPMLDSIVARALEKDVSLRWQSAAAMRDALESWLASHGRAARQEDVARAMNGLFAEVRDEVHRQIQKYMTATTPPAISQDTQPLTKASLERMREAGVNAGAQLIQLGGSGSGSGVIAHYGGLASNPSGPTGHPPPMHPPVAAKPNPLSKNSALLIVLTVGCFMLAALVILVVGLHDGKRKDREAVARRDGVTDPALATAPPPAAAPILTAPPESVPVLPPSSEPTPTSSEGSPVSAPTRHGRVPGASTRAITAKASASPPESEPGFLTVSSYPWAKVSEGGRVICPVTPCNKVQMSAGVHSLTFESGDQPGQKQTVIVLVKSGETATKNVGLK